MPPIHREVHRLLHRLLERTALLPAGLAWKRKSPRGGGLSVAISYSGPALPDTGNPAVQDPGITGKAVPIAPASNERDGEHQTAGAKRDCKPDRVANDAFHDLSSCSDLHKKRHRASFAYAT